MKKSFAGRIQELWQNYINDLSGKTHEEKVELWNKYKTNYENYQNGDEEK